MPEISTTDLTLASTISREDGTVWKDDMHWKKCMKEHYGRDFGWQSFITTKKCARTILLMHCKLNSL